MSAVYKIIFNDSHFYIGSSINVRVRIGHWIFRIKNNIPKNKNVKKILPLCKKVVFQIIEIVPDKTLLKNREDHYIKTYWGSPLMLNRCPNAFDNFGMKMNDEEIANLISSPSATRTPLTIKQRDELAKKRVDNGSIYRVGKYTMDGDLVCIYNSVIQAASYSLTTSKSIGEHFSGKNKHVGGYIYFKISQDDSIIPHPVFVSKKRGNKKGFKHSPEVRKRLTELLKSINDRMITDGEMNAKKRKPVSQYDLNGNYIASFVSSSEAARQLNLSNSNISKASRGLRPQTGGFIFKQSPV